MELVVHLRAAVALLGRFPALAGADLEVAHGEIVLLRGPNGAGKTTLLRTCAGLLKVVAGEANVLGVDLTRHAASVRRRVGLLGHAPGLYEELDAAANARFWARAVGADDTEVRQALDSVGLVGRLAAVPVARLSSGQRRRAALASLLVRRPELWLLDEPHSGLDDAAREQLNDVLRRAVAAGATVVFSSHEHDRAAELAHRVVEVVAGTTSPSAAGAGSYEGELLPGRADAAGVLRGETVVTATVPRAT